MMKPYFEDVESEIVIYHGDCRDILPTLGPVDLVLTDPPYGVGISYGVYNDTRKAWRELMVLILPWIQRNASMGILPCARVDELQWIYKNYPPDWIIAWYKGSPGARGYLGFQDWEPLLVYGKTQGIQMHDFFRATPEPFINGHPCPKPVAWALWLIARASFVEQIVVDLCMGSGTTLVAAKKLGRRAIGIEIEERYCEIAARRIMATPRPLFTEPTTEQAEQQELF